MKNYGKMDEKQLLIEHLMCMERIEKKLPDANKPTLAMLGFINNTQLMSMLGIGRAKAAQLRNSGAIRFCRRGTMIFYKISDVIEFLNGDFDRK